MIRSPLKDFLRTKRLVPRSIKVITRRWVRQGTTLLPETNVIVYGPNSLHPVLGLNCMNTCYTTFTILSLQRKRFLTDERVIVTSPLGGIGDPQGRRRVDTTVVPLCTRTGSRGRSREKVIVVIRIQCIEKIL